MRETGWSCRRDVGYVIADFVNCLSRVLVIELISGEGGNLALLGKIFLSWCLVPFGLKSAF